MNVKREYKLLYVILMILVLVIATIGSTYAYWAATTSSTSNALNTGSTIYSISMELNPLYHGTTFIPMDDTDALKGLGNECKDKYGRGACSAYTIYVYGYNEGLDYISGVMNINTTNMQNISYMMLRISDEYNEENCVKIENENYCIAKEATPMGEGKDLSLGDKYDVRGMTSTKFILLMWLSNLEESQNDTDVGSFNAEVTMQAGNGGKIQGTIQSAIHIENGDNPPPTDDNTNSDNTSSEDNNPVEEESTNG